MKHIILAILLGSSAVFAAEPAQPPAHAATGATDATDAANTAEATSKSGSNSGAGGAPGIAGNLPVGNSTLTESIGRANGLENITLGYFGIFHGGTLTRIDSPNTVDNSGRLTSKYAMNFDSSVSAAYKFNRSMGFGPVVPFLLVPVKGQGLILGDVGVSVFDKKTVDSNGFTLATNLTVQAPTSEASQARNMNYAIKTTPSARYHFPRSRFGMGTWTEAKAYMGVTKGKTLKLWVAPYVNYQLSPKVLLNLQYEMEAHHNVTDQRSVDLTNYMTDLQPGVVWLVSPQVMVNPFIQIFTGNRISPDTTAIGAVISATVL